MKIKQANLAMQSAKKIQQPSMDGLIIVMAVRTFFDCCPAGAIAYDLQIAR